MGLDGIRWDGIVIFKWFDWVKKKIVQWSFLFEIKFSDYVCECSKKCPGNEYSE